MEFWLGTHEVGWLEVTSVPLFISRVRLQKRARLPRARCPWALDSGGFTALDGHGRWDLTPDAYVELVARYQDEIGNLAWAAPMDWMCEPRVRAMTGLSVREHQQRTVQSYLDLRDRGPFIPVLQGWDPDDYHACVDLYTEAGVDLTAQPLVGLGTVCRRQDTPVIVEVVNGLAARGLRLHGFGVKKRGLHTCGHMLASADSMAWSTRGRMAWQHERRQLCQRGGHRGSCANCRAWAEQWRDQVVDGLGLFATAFDAQHASGDVDQGAAPSSKKRPSTPDPNGASSAAPWSRREP